MLVSVHLLSRILDGGQAREEAKTPTQADFSEMVLTRRHELHGATDKLIAGTFTPDDWANFFESVLTEGHTAAWQMGRNLAGDLEEDLNDLLRGLEKKEGELTYLRDFLAALKAKDTRYWDAELEKFRSASIKARQDLYLGAMRGTAGEAFVAHSPDKAEFYWRLGGTEDHCEECPQLAEMSPWKKDELWTSPGAGDTPCHGNCLCHLERDDEVTSFKRVELS